jgi:hypothetical protein
MLIHNCQKNINKKIKLLFVLERSRIPLKTVSVQEKGKDSPGNGRDGRYSRGYGLAMKF